MSDIAQTLAERGNRYGDFKEHARITQNIKLVMSKSPNWIILADDQKEALEMIAHKIGRILNGDPNYHDSWHDLVGYAKLVADRILQDGKDIDGAIASIAQQLAPSETSRSTGVAFADSGFTFGGKS